MPSVSLGAPVPSGEDSMPRETAAWFGERSRKLTLGLGTGHQPTDVLKAKSYKVGTGAVCVVRTLPAYVCEEKLDIATGYANVWVNEASWEVLSTPYAPLSSHAAPGCGFSNPVVSIPARSPRRLLAPLSPAILTVSTHLLPEQWLLYWKILESDADSFIRVSLAQSISGMIYNSLTYRSQKDQPETISLHSAGPH